MKEWQAGLRGQERGVVYVEFLLAFPPLFLIFMAVCQLSLVASARLVVQHAAVRAARSAIVVLEEEPRRYGGAPRGRLSQGGEQPRRDFADLLAGLGLAAAQPPENRAFVERFMDTMRSATVPQQGARMRPIRNAAYVPLITLAPQSLGATSDQSLGSALRGDFASRWLDSLLYTRSAAVITVNQGPGSAALVMEPVGRDAPVTVRVTYFYRCSVPIVRALVCRSLERLLGRDAPVPSERAWEKWASLEHRFELAEDPGRLRDLARHAYFKVLEAEATLPNQGAGYYTGDAEDEP